MDQIVPLTTSPNQTVTAQLQVDGKSLTLNLALRFSEMAGYWILAIMDSFGNLLLDSIPLITGVYPSANLLAQYQYLAIGSAYIISMGTSSSDYPGSTDLGSGFQLLWGDTYEPQVSS